MKSHRIITSVAVIMALLMTINVQAQRILPLTVKQFLDELAFTNHLPLTVRSSYHFSQFFPPRMIDGQEMVDAFIAVDDMSAISKLQQAGVVVNCCFDGFVTAQIPVDDLVGICEMPCVRDIEISRKMTLCTDSTLNVTHAGQVLDGINNGLPQSYDGTGVIIATLDVGYDYQHLAFRRSDNPAVTRIKRVYSTTDRSGHPARFNNNIRLPGSVFIDDEIYALKTDNKTTGHGTHTTSIAAGTHVGPYGGMAPNADIVMCALSELEGSISTTEIANCLRYVDSYADSVGKPCVMSMSISTFAGPHDGQDYLANVVTQLMGPGRLFVFAAGNNGGVRTYAYKEATEDNPLNLLLTYNNSSSIDSTYKYYLCMADIWMRTSATNISYKYHLLDKYTNRIVWESSVFSGSSLINTSELSTYFTYDTSRDTTGYIKGQVNYSVYSKKYQLSLLVYNLISKNYGIVDNVKKGRYAIGISIWPKVNRPTIIDAWTCNSCTGFSFVTAPVVTLDNQTHRGFYNGASDSCSINTQGVCDSVITAGAYVGRNSYYSLFRGYTVTDRSFTVGDAAKFSSYQAAGKGPTGKALPTVCAPGVYVVSDVSRYSSYASGGNMTVMKTDDGHYWGAMSGTSMATPTVAGIIALWLQANPNLSVAEVKDIMYHTGIHDNFTNGTHSAQFGACGKIDALAGMRLVLERMHYDIGDVNGDGLINLADVVELVDFVLGYHPNEEAFDKVAADINGDGSINVADIVELIDLIL